MIIHPNQENSPIQNGIKDKKSVLKPKSQEVANSLFKVEKESPKTPVLLNILNKSTKENPQAKRIIKIASFSLPPKKAEIPESQKGLNKLNERVSELSKALESAPKAQEMMNLTPKSWQKKTNDRSTIIRSFENTIKVRNRALWEQGADRHQFLSFVVFDALNRLSNQEEVEKVAETVNPLFSQELDNALSTTELYINQREKIEQMKKRLSTATKDLYEPLPGASSRNLKQLENNQERLAQYLRSDVAVLLNEMANIKKNTSIQFSQEVEKKYELLKALIAEHCSAVVPLRPDE